MKCVICGRQLQPADRRTHPACVAAVRSALMEIVELYALLPGELLGHAGAATPPGGLRGDGAGLPDALVLLGPGSAATNQARDIIAGRPNGHADDELPSHPPSVVGELGRWEDDWLTVQRDQGMRVAVPQTPATVTGSSTYLLESLNWAAQNHDSFDEFATDMHRLKQHLRAATRSANPVEHGVPCPYCGHRIIRPYDRPTPCHHPARPHCDHSADRPKDWPCHGSNTCPCDQGGRPDDWVCSSRDCGATFDPDKYNLAVWANWQQLHDQAAAG